jgi:branched-chain amino acid transport system permease protein
MYLPSGTYNVNYRQDMAFVRTRFHWGISITALVLIAIMPLFVPIDFITLTNFIGITIVVTHGLNILAGYAGQMSLGQSAFMMVGAYTSAILTRHLGCPFLLALLLSGLTAGVVGLIFGIPSLRVKGFYLAMATLAAQFIIPWLIVNVRPDITAGAQSFRVPAMTIGNMKFSTQTEMFYIIIPIAGLMTLFAKNLSRSKLGRAFVAIRDNDLAAEVQGIDIFRYKLIAFFICSFYAGVGGSLWAHWVRAVNSDQFTLMHSIWFLGIIIVGGMGSISGIVMGSVFIRLLDYLAALITPVIAKSMPAISSQIEASLTPIIFGFLVLLFVILEPRGLYHRWEILKAKYRMWPYSY